MRRQPVVDALEEGLPFCFEEVLECRHTVRIDVQTDRATLEAWTIVLTPTQVVFDCRAEPFEVAGPQANLVLAEFGRNVRALHRTQPTVAGLLDGVRCTQLLDHGDHRQPGSVATREFGERW